MSRTFLSRCIFLAFLLFGCNIGNESSAGEVDADGTSSASRRDGSVQGEKPINGGTNSGESDGAGSAAAVEPTPEGSSCDMPVYPLLSNAALDFSSSTTILACMYTEENSEYPLYPVREDVEGSPVCENLSRPCLDEEGAPCSHDCEANSDCPSGNVCVCAAGVNVEVLERGVVYNVTFNVNQYVAGPNRCVPALCTGASDCGGWACGMSREVDSCRGETNGFYCRSSSDDCSSDLDCEPNGICTYNSEKWMCRLRVICDENRWLLFL